MERHEGCGEGLALNLEEEENIVDLSLPTIEASPHNAKYVPSGFYQHVQFNQLLFVS